MGIEKKTTQISDLEVLERMKVFHTQNFDRLQVDEIKQGVRSGVDVSIYADKKYIFLQMAEIRKGLESEIDVTPYLDEEYDWFQMREIRRGIIEGVDVSVYLDKSMDYLLMREIRHGLKDGINLMPYYKKGYHVEILKELREAFKDGVNIELYIDADYDEEQLEQIRLGLKNGIDITFYLDSSLTGGQMYEIRRGLEEKLDISRYAKSEYNWMQMRELRLGLMSKVDTGWYEDSLFSHREMREIRLGLEDGVDVSEYAQHMWSSVDMQNHRINLKNFGVSESVLSNPDSELVSYDDFEFVDYDIPDEMLTEDESSDEDISDVIVTPVDNISDEDNTVWTSENQRVTINISEDKLFAFIKLPDISGQAGFSEKEIAAALRLGGVRQGVKKDVIDKIVAGQKFEEEDIVIAEGKLPTEGQDAYYEYFFKRELDHKPELNEDGSVNYANVTLFEQVEEGQVIAVYHPAVRGMYGFDVTGKLIHPKNVESIPRLMGKNIKLLDDEITYIATVTGCIEEKDGNITINKIYVVDGDVSLSSGNINFDGDVEVRGDVKPRAIIEATGNITVKGCVEAAFLKAGHDILVKQGVLGKGMGIIEAGNDISGKYFENVKIYAEHDVRSNYLYNCNCIAMNRVEISGRKGAIVGGITSAIYGIEAAELGNKMGLKTQFDVGANEYFVSKLRDWDTKIKDLSVKITIFKEELKKLEVKFKLDILKDSPMYQNVRTAMHQLMNEMDDLKKEKDTFTTELYRNSNAIGIRVSGRAYAGCLVVINNAKLLLDKDVNRIWFREKNQNIVELLN